MKDNFDNCHTLVLVHEGGYVDHPDDPGGATKWGVTTGTYRVWRRSRGLPPKPVKYMTVSEADNIYRSRYWAPINGDRLPIGIDYTVYDASVNSGVGRGPKWMQAAIKVKVDGKVGGQTLKALDDLDEAATIRVIKVAAAKRLGFLKGLSIWGTFGRGWARRVSEVEAGSIAMVAGSTLRAEAEDSKAKMKHEITGVVGTGSGAGALGSIADLPSLVVYAGLALVAVLAVVTYKRYTAEQDRAVALTRAAEAYEQEESVS
jgi:lysozyme family protein